MVEDEGDVRRALRQVHPQMQLVGPQAEVEAEVMVGQVAQVFDEKVRLASPIRMT